MPHVRAGALARDGVGAVHQAVLANGCAQVVVHYAGLTRAQRSSGETSSMLRMYLEKSMTIAWLHVWPASAVPPPPGGLFSKSSGEY